MSTQGGTLQSRRTIELPIWPVAVLVVVAIAAAIGMAALGDAGQTSFVTSVSDSERFANSTAAVREQGSALPVRVGISHVAPSLHGSTSATIGTGWDSIGGQNEALHRQFSAPLAANGTVAWGSIGGPNEALHRQFSPPQDGVALAPTRDPIIVNGEPCMQCR